MKLTQQQLYSDGMSKSLTAEHYELTSQCLEKKVHQDEQPEDSLVVHEVDSELLDEMITEEDTDETMVEVTTDLGSLH